MLVDRSACGVFAQHFDPAADGECNVCAVFRILEHELAEKIERMIERFDDNDDVQQIYHNAILPEVEEEE